MGVSALRVLHVTHLYHPSVGGVQVHIQHLTEHLLQLDPTIHIEVFTSRSVHRDDFHRRTARSAALQKREVINNVTVHRFAIWYNCSRFLFTFLPTVKGGYKILRVLFNGAISCLRMGPFTPGMLIAIFRYRPDIVLLINSHNAHAFFCCLAQRTLGFRLVTIAGLGVAKEHAVVNSVIRHSDHFIALTEHEKRYLLQKGIAERRISVIGPGVNLDQFSLRMNSVSRIRYRPCSGPVIGFLGRQVPGKGVEHLIDSMRHIWTKYPTATLLIAGPTSPSLKEKLNDHINRIPNIYKSQIIRIDAYSEAQKNDLFHALDVFAMPSAVDTFGIVYLEAWACKKPVIACTNTPPATFIKDERDGLLVDYGNVRQLADAIIFLLDNPKQRHKFGKEGYKKVRAHYTWHAVASKVAAIYKQLGGTPTNTDSDSGSHVGDTPNTKSHIT